MAVQTLLQLKARPTSTGQVHRTRDATGGIRALHKLLACKRRRLIRGATGGIKALLKLLACKGKQLVNSTPRKGKLVKGLLSLGEQLTISTTVCRTTQLGNTATCRAQRTRLPVTPTLLKCKQHGGPQRRKMGLWKDSWVGFNQCLMLLAQLRRRVLLQTCTETRSSSRNETWAYPRSNAVSTPSNKVR
mmetsp:Transcript_77327/g.145844  ORF Transcript_77327/g.145844 Transcript_77327/m.145844 type:complete len:189 (-) Transcript_77327:3-569(-)